jgi:hypothetical protein
MCVCISSVSSVSISISISSGPFIIRGLLWALPRAQAAHALHLRSKQPQRRQRNLKQTAAATACLCSPPCWPSARRRVRVRRGAAAHGAALQLTLDHTLRMLCRPDGGLLWSPHTSPCSCTTCATPLLLLLPPEPGAGDSPPARACASGAEA